MNLMKLLTRVVLGKRLPQISGKLSLPGLKRPIRIRRDRHGIPHIDAENYHDAVFALGVVHAQDRAGQLELLVRLCSGTLSELAGPRTAAVDLIARKVGFRFAAHLQWPKLSSDVQQLLVAYTNGINALIKFGRHKAPHECLFRGETTLWEPQDVLAYMKTQTWFMGSNWDCELARLKIYLSDGPEALKALDPVLYGETGLTLPDLGAHDRPGLTALERLTADLSTFRDFFPQLGGSNNWVVAPGKSSTGRPILANDPHLGASIPAPWYYASIRTPEIKIAGATFAGTPVFPCAHNGYACWGVTAGLSDNTDLFLEKVRQVDGRHEYLQDDQWQPCLVRQETIKIKGKPDQPIEIITTPRGPIISEALPEVPYALSLRAIWLDPLPVKGWLATPGTRSFAEFRNCFQEWPSFPMNLVYADESGKTGWQFVGQLPVRKRGHGLMPMAGWDSRNGWENKLMPFSVLPMIEDPKNGFVATANNRPRAETIGAYLGSDWLDRYRYQAIVEDLERIEKVSIEDCRQTQLNVVSIPWRELKALLLGLLPQDWPTAVINLMKNWDGRITADSSAATIFNVFMAKICVEIGKAKAPNTWKWALGVAPSALNANNFFGYRRWAHAIRLMNDQPDGWFAEGWPAKITAVLRETIQELDPRRCGPADNPYPWGKVRPLVLEHLMFGESPLRKAFNLGPVPCSGDEHTPNHASAMPLDPLGGVNSLPNIRAIFDVGNWSASRFQMAGGQSGNPFSPYYGNLFELWQRGEGIPIPFTEAEVAQATVHELTLEPH